MSEEFITLTAKNIATEHLCCIIRSRKPHPGVEAKRTWLAARIKEGHVFRKLDAKGCCFIEYAPVDTAWVPVVGSGFLYIYCLWVDTPFKGKGYATRLMQSCIDDAKTHGLSGVCMLGSKKQKNWLSNQTFAKRFGFTAVDTTTDGYELLALSFDGTAPHFTDAARAQQIDSNRPTIYYSPQCPFIPQKIEDIRIRAAAESIEVDLICVDSLEKAKALPCVFNNWGVFVHGHFETVNLLDVNSFLKLLQE